MNKDNYSSYKGQGIVTLLIITGLFIAYIAQMHPSAVLPIIMDDLGISMTQAGLGVSIIFPFIIVFSILGAYIEQKQGIKKLFIWTMGLVAIGILTNLIATSYFVFLVGRILFGIGFGLSIPFIGSAIMMWYKPKQREVMNTVNALFPYVANVLVFGATMPMFVAFGNSWRAALGIWGFVALVAAIAWIFWGKERKMSSDEFEVDASADEKEEHLYLNLWKRKEIKILCIIFITDFFGYSFIIGILPTFLNTVGGVSLEAANNISILFPFAGIISGSLAGVIMNRTGKRKPMLWIGQALKMVGVILIVLGATNFIGWIGIAFVGFGNCLWIPSMYTIPMDLEDMTPTRVGAAFAFISSCGFAAGFVSPIIGNWLGETYNLLVSFIVAAVIYGIGLVTSLIIRETGPGIPTQSGLTEESSVG